MMMMAGLDALLPNARRRVQEQLSAQRQEAGFKR
jgi:hypothetical protein